MKRKETMALLLCFVCLLVTGCRKPYERIYYKDIANYHVEEIMELRDLQEQPNENCFTWVKNNKAFIWFEKGNEHNFFAPYLNRLYAYDFTTRQVEEIHLFDYAKEQRFVVDLVEINDCYLYAWLNMEEDGWELKIEEKRNDETKTLATTKIYNNAENKPFFITYDDSVYFILTDCSFDQHKVSKMNQKFVQYKDGRLNTIFEETTNYEDGNWDGKGSFMYTNKLYHHKDGSIIFQDFAQDTSNVYRYENGHIQTFHIDSVQEHLRGYLGGYAVMYSTENKKHFLLDLDTGDRKDIAYDNTMRYTMNLKDTVMFVGADSKEGNDDKWLFSIKESGEIEIVSVYDFHPKIGRKTSDPLFLYIGSDGEHTIVEVQEYQEVAGASDYKTNFYRLSFP